MEMGPSNAPRAVERERAAHVATAHRRLDLDNQSRSAVVRTLLKVPSPCLEHQWSRCQTVDGYLSTGNSRQQRDTREGENLGVEGYSNTGWRSSCSMLLV